MKKAILTLMTIAAAAAVAHAQGTFWFQNYGLGTPSGNAPITIGNNGKVNEGAVGAFVGSDYTASLYFLNGTGPGTTAAFDLASPALVVAANSPFFGVTGTAAGGHGPTGDGSGLFSWNSGAGIFNLSAASGATVTVETRVWYNVGFNSYDAAVTGGANVGESNPVTLTLAVAPAQPVTMDAMNAFSVQPVPEPGTLAFAGLGAAALMIFRRRK